MDQAHLSVETIEKNNFSSTYEFIIELIKVFFLAVVIIIPIRLFLFQPFFVQGSSMVPNFHDKEYLIINEFGYKTTEVGLGKKNLFTVEPFKLLERGDVVVFRYPQNPDQFFIKRIIGLPGERIEIKNSIIYIYDHDGKQSVILDESNYLSSDVLTEPNLTRILKEDEYFVMGDNRQFSHDSRSWGVLPQDHIIGKVLLRAWPFADFSIF